MAEKYGTVPPRWTKEWWEYFWFYYKWRVLGIAFVVVCVLVTVTQCVTRDKYDITVTYAGNMIYSEEETERFQNAAAEYIDDVDGNGEKSVFFQTLNFTNQPGSEEYDYASQSKLELTFYDDGAFLFLHDEAELAEMLGRESASEIYVPVSEWAQKDIDESRLYLKDGVAYAVNLKGSAFLEENGIYNDDLYVIVRANYSDDELNARAWDSSVELANILIN